MMTREQLDQAKNEVLDAEAAKVMGWSHSKYPICQPFPCFTTGSGRVHVYRHIECNGPHWSPATDIADAWELVEKMNKPASGCRWWLKLVQGPMWSFDFNWKDRDTNGFKATWERNHTDPASACHPSAPRAITTAALLAWGRRRRHEHR